MTRRWAASANGYRWLEAGLSQSPVATRASSPKLHPGLHKLDVEKSWLHVEDDCFARDMLLKELVFGDPGERDDVLVVGAEPEAEWEVWELVSAFLTRKFPETFTKVDGTAVRASRGDYDRVVDAAKTTPLEAASLLAQEDFFILNHDRLVSAACVFSFGAVRRRTRERQSLDELHAKVGGYRRDLATIVTKAITTVATKSPMWRSNWSFSLSDSMRPTPDRDFLNLEKRTTVHGETDGPTDFVEAKVAALARLRADGIGENLFCKIEFQTLRRLPRSQRVLFTVHTYVEPFNRLTPRAATHLATNIRLATDHDISLYKNLEDPDVTDVILRYLDDKATEGRP